MHIAVNNETTPFPVCSSSSPDRNGRPPPHNHYFCNYHTLWLEETALFSPAIKAIERLSTEGGKRQKKTGGESQNRKKKPSEKNEKTRGTRKRLGEKQNQGKILVHQPAAPRAFTTLVFVLNGEDWTEN
ncbi:hypothetical protein Peur_013046 [Populus x canadensis]